MSAEPAPMQTAEHAVADAPTSRVPLTSSAFTDRVMAAIVDAPAPGPTRSLVLALRRGTLPDAARSLLVASHLVTVRTWPIAPRVRARSFALVLGVAFLLGTASVAAAAAVHAVAPLRLSGPAAIEVSAFDSAPEPTERRPAASAPIDVGVGSGRIKTKGDDTAVPKASKVRAAGQAVPHKTAPAGGTERDESAGHDGSHGTPGAGDAPNSNDSDDGGNDGDASDGSEHHGDSDDRNATDDSDHDAGRDDGGDHDDGDTGG